MVTILIFWYCSSDKHNKTENKVISLAKCMVMALWVIFTNITLLGLMHYLGTQIITITF